MKISPAPAQGWLVRFSTMRRFRAQFFITAAVCQANYCRGWIPTRFSSLSLATRSTATCNTHAIISRHPQQHCNLWTNRRTCATIRSSNSRSSARLRRRRTSLAYKKDGDDDDDDDDDDGIAEESWDPRKMDSGGVLPRCEKRTKRDIVNWGLLLQRALRWLWSRAAVGTVTDPRHDDLSHISVERGVNSTIFVVDDCGNRSWHARQISVGEQATVGTDCAH